MSAQSVIPFWGQAWELSIAYSGSPVPYVVSTDRWEPESLRITFEVLESTIPDPWWYADIVVYNLDPAAIRTIQNQAVSVTLKAGFQAGVNAPPTTIWTGPILQVLFDTENVVDTRLTLHCVANPVTSQYVQAFSLGFYASQAQLVSNMATNAGLPPMNVTQNNLSPYAQQQLTVKQYPRGNTVFGSFNQYLDIVANDQQLNTFRDASKTYMTEISKGNLVPQPDYIFAQPNPPNTYATGLPAGTCQTLIGTPRQFQQGVIFTVLLDPRLRVTLPIQVVRLAGNPVVSQIPIQPSPGGGVPPTPLTDLVLFVAQVRHFGDSRGNDWYTEVTGYSTTYAASLLTGVFSGSTQ